MRILILFFCSILLIDVIDLGKILSAKELFSTNFRKIKLIKNSVTNGERHSAFPFYPFDSNIVPQLNPLVKQKRTARSPTRPPKISTSLLDTHFYLWRNYLTKVDGPKCPHLPTCSHFAYLSIKKYGLRGSYYTTSRLLGEFGDLSSYGFYELHIINGRGRIYDPVKSYQTLDTITIKQSNY